MAEALDIVLAGEAMRLYAARGLYWPARRRLLVADLHLGKGDAFRSAGIALPSGGTIDDLARLASLVRLSGARSLWVLGDLLHGSRVQAPWRAHWTRFLADHTSLEIVLVDGNHDRAVARAGLGIVHGAARIKEGPFVFTHAPVATPLAGERLGLCGHLHPVARIDGLRGRFPAFARVGDQFILPAFSAFTGGWLIDHADARYGCVGQEVLDLGPGRPARRRPVGSGGRRTRRAGEPD